MVKNGVSTQLTNAMARLSLRCPATLVRALCRIIRLSPRKEFIRLATESRFSPEQSMILSTSILGAAFDSLNFRTAAGGGVLSAAADADDNVNTAPDYVSGYNVNTIAIQVPITMLTSTGNLEAATSPARHYRRLGNHFPPAHFRSSPTTASRGFGWLVAGSAHGQSSD